MAFEPKVVLPWVLLRIGFFAFALGGAPALAESPAAPAPPAPSPDPEREAPGSDMIRIGCFNVGWFSGVPGAGYVPRTPQDFMKIARVVRATRADVMQLEEVSDLAALEVLAAGLNQLGRGTTDFRHVTPEGESLFIPSGDARDRQNIGYVYDARRVSLHFPRTVVELGRARFTRLPSQVSVRVVGARLAFDMIGVHLKSGLLDEDDIARRSEEVRLLTEWLYLERKGDKDFVVLGDFNSPRDHESMAALDALADQGELVAIEDHLAGEARGTHIPFDVALDRAFMSPALWKRVGSPDSGSIYRFDDYMPRAMEFDGFCIHNRSRVRKKELRCDCEEKAGRPDPDSVPPSAGSTLPASATKVAPDEATECAGDVRFWIKAANYVRVSDHRPLLWDLRTRRPRKGPRSAQGVTISTVPTGASTGPVPGLPAPAP